MKKNYIMTPGPVPISNEVLIEHGRPLIHHRSPEFSKIFVDVTDKLKKFMQTENDVFVLTSSGTGTMEAAVTNAFSVGDKVLVISVGNFGERFKKISTKFGLNVISLDYEWGEAANPADIKKAVEGNPDIKGVMIQHSETSTGVLNDIEAVGDIVKDHPAVLIVDAISGIGASELKVDDWHLDIVCGGSQKALSAPTGAAFISVSSKAWKQIDQSNIPRFYFDLIAAKKYTEKTPPQTPWTPGISIIAAMAKALELFFDEGREKVYERHRVNALAVQRACEKLGLELLVKDPRARGVSVTSIKVPESIDGKILTRTMRMKYGVTVAGGQGKLQGLIFRIGHLGYVGIFDVLTAISALEFALKEQGWKFELGAGILEVEKVFWENNYMSQ
ncbi:MAG: alanine--glyoxylate aminotransferase family protein [Actinobacteria bacterium]|nr:alanine--glyoxylate aminotransferase family protein [Actinomycetota bacterium]MBM3712969.1 alanine--glyoxylate aminotransferase family protein [Actinomycetota bacterium]